MGVPYFTAFPAFPGQGTTPFFAAAPTAYADLLVIEANTSVLATESTGALAVSFPWQPAFPGLCTSGPTIAQARSDTIAASRSYFYADFS
jgi:hypothetical protein